MELKQQREGKEIGGYQDFEQYHRPMLYEDGVKLNCGRNSLAYLIRSRRIKKILLPYFLCDSVIDVCRQYAVGIRFYHVQPDLRPEKLALEDDEWLYLVNYYGQLTKDEIRGYRDSFIRVIADNAQAYFDAPAEGVDTLYTCRKFFGVPDGAILYTDSPLNEQLERDESFEHMTHLMGRYERTASEFFTAMVENNHRFSNCPLKRMSRLTENLLRSFDYEDIKRRRTENFQALANRLGDTNLLRVRDVEGAFAYPWMVENAAYWRKELIAHKIYVPTLWPNVLTDTDEEWTDHRLAQNILPIPCDQRYGLEEMTYICDLIEKGSALF